MVSQADTASLISMAEISSSVLLRFVKSSHFSVLVSMTPLADLEEGADPVVTELTARDQPVTDVPIFTVSVRLVKSKLLFLIVPLSTLSFVVSSVEEEDEEEESVSSVQAAKAAPIEEKIITDKRRARNLLFLLFVVFM